MNEPTLFPEMPAAPACGRDAPGAESCGGPRLRRPNRAQAELRACVLDETIPPEHHARVIWAVVERLDVSAFEAPVQAREGEAGRPATDPRLLLALWLWATTQGVGSARELARLCECHDAYRWLCGGVSVNYHTLSDFRVANEKALDALMTEVLALLMAKDLVSVKRISQDGLRVRASAGKGSFHQQATLEKCLAEAQMQVEATKRQREAAPAGERPSRRDAAAGRAARERQKRVEGALAQMPVLKAIKAKHNGKKSPEPPRASTTDPEARKMKMPDGGVRPAYNVQVATDVESRAVLGVDVTNEGTDHNQSEPMRGQVEGRTGHPVDEHLMDGGFVKRESIERAEASGVRVYAPPKQSRGGPDPCAVRADDSPELAAWRNRMGTAEGQSVYRQRAATSETVNADFKAHRGLGRFVVRGLSKVRCVVLWCALAYNLMHFGRALLV